MSLLSIEMSSSWAMRMGITALLWTLYLVYTREVTPLRKIPGPFMASLSKFWIVNKQRGFKRPLVDINLHKKYGPIVRVAPNEVMVSSPKSFRTIYGAGSHFPKGEWYIGTGDCGWSGPDNLDLLSEKNMEKYRAQRRAVGPAYSENYMRDIEKNLDSIIAKNIGIMRQRAGQSVDLDIFFNMFASDCLSMATFSKAKNLIELNKADESIHFIHRIWKYMHLAGYFPHFHRLFKWCTHGTSLSWLKRIIRLLSPLMDGRDRTSKTVSLPPEHAFAFPISNIQQRMAQREDGLTSATNEPPTDIAAKLLQLQTEKGQLSDKWIMSMCMTNYGAGVETIGITVSALVNNIVTHGCQDRIHQEIASAKKAGKLSTPPKLREMKDHLPYLSACLSESQRVHPVIGMPLVRTVPEGGCEVEGKFLPAGTTVGLNPWVFARDKSLYGEDANVWRPERWLEYSREKVKYLETYNITFGTGARSCPGKYLAQAVYTKIIPMLFSDFKWSFTDPDAVKVLQCTFSVRYMRLMMQWKVREETTETR
ncbi:benzoate 4-monooxygenase cytochrome P450 [Rhexocercosporidium sp. MPI-PUGE-AT-0058]|nr:benzoate 4-monooxygenase cytochrome P450 [Rhexocercosporidium sp. MPI-PUGE-AT-0058]